MNNRILQEILRLRSATRRTTAVKITITKFPETCLPWLLLIAVASLASCSGPGPAAELDGERLFFDNCAECHRADGQGIPNVYPALDGSEIVSGSGADVALVLIIGRGEMPSFRGALSSAEMAAVVNYVRNAWSNSGEAITARQIDAL